MTTPPTPPPNLERINVLVVEDHEDSRTLLAEALTFCGAVVEVASDVTSAIELLERWRPHAIVTDVSMRGGEDGYALLSKIRATRHLTDVPVVAITGFGRTLQDGRWREAGFAAYLLKPVEPFEVARTIARFVDR